jgi:hypothetical protein
MSLHNIDLRGLSFSPNLALETLPICIEKESTFMYFKKEHDL